MTFAGKVVLVTGAASGIGKAFSEYFVKEGAQVIVADVNEEAGKKVTASLNGSKSEAAHFVKCDVTDYKSCLSAFKVGREFGQTKRIDIVLSMAGTLDLAQPAYPAAEKPSDLDAFFKDSQPPNMKCLEIGLLGALYVAHIALAVFRAQEPDQNGCRGKILLAGSEAGIIHMAGDVLYGVTKAGNNSLARNLGTRVAAEGIYVNAFAPNLVETAILPPEAFAGAKSRDELSSPDQLVQNVIKHFLNPSSKLSGHLLGGNGKEFELRAIPKYFSPASEKNAEIFYPPDAIKAALVVPEGTVFREL